MTSSCLLFAVTLASYAIGGCYSLDLARHDAMNGMEELPQDLGDYDLWTCTGEGDDRTCEFNDEEIMTYARVCLVDSCELRLLCFNL